MIPIKVYYIIYCLGCVLITLIALCILSSCYNPSTKELESLTDLLNKADRKTCIYYSGSAGPYVSIRGVTSLGDIDFATCLRKGIYD